MGIIPPELQPGTATGSLDLDGNETFDAGLSGGIAPGMAVTMLVHRVSGETATIALKCRMDTSVEAVG